MKTYTAVLFVLLAVNSASAADLALKGTYYCMDFDRTNVRCTMDLENSALIQKAIKPKDQFTDQAWFDSDKDAYKKITGISSWRHLECMATGKATINITNAKLVYGEDGSAVTGKITSTDLQSLEIEGGNSCKAMLPSSSKKESGDTSGERFLSTHDLASTLSQYPIEFFNKPDENAQITETTIEIDASSKIRLFQPSSGPSVIATYFEDNHGNPWTRLYMLKGKKWVEIGSKIVPGYTGRYDDYFELTENGLKKWRGVGKKPLNYLFHNGAFKQVGN